MASARKDNFFFRLQVYEWMGNFSKKCTVKGSGKLSFLVLKRNKIDGFCGCKTVKESRIPPPFRCVTRASNVGYFFL